MSSIVGAHFVEVPGYEVIRLIGRGGMGEVHLARQTSIGRLVAIKLLTIPSETHRAEFVERFRREIEIMGKINHPNVVSIYDSGETNGRPFLVMEFLERGDLRRMMSPGRPFPNSQVLGLIRPIAEALCALHAHNVLHRDLKPENILMANDTTPKLTDFGIALLGDSNISLTKAGEWRGTIGYVAPEQQYQLPIDERADQYSLAAIAHELLTGQKKIGRFQTLPSSLNPALPIAVDDVLRKGLQDDPDDRYTNPLQFVEALESALASYKEPLQFTGPQVVIAMAFTAIVGLIGFGVIQAVHQRWKEADRGTEASRKEIGTVDLPRISSGIAKRSVLESMNMKTAMVLDEPASFMMGSPPSDVADVASESPRHEVTLTIPYALSVTEVTIAQFRKFVVQTGYITDAEKNGGGCVYDSEKQILVHDPSLSWRHPRLEGRFSEEEPVTQVSWNDAVAFVEWLAVEEGKPYRLPTEAEWEYACRDGSQASWSFGDKAEALEQHAWTTLNTKGKPERVGRKLPNKLGLFDMHGNVWEWCSDYSGDYSSEPARDPQGPTTGTMRMLRGGSFDSHRTERTRSAARLDSDPAQGYFNYGFRVCLPAR